MMVSSLYWAQAEGDITPDQTAEYAQRITDLYKFNDYHNTFFTQYMLRHTIDHYHRKGWYYEEMEKKRDDAAMKIVRRQLHDQPLAIPEQLNRWLQNPLTLFTDFGRAIPEDEGLKRVRERDRAWQEQVRSRRRLG